MKTIKLWDVKTGRKKTLKGHSYWVFSVIYSPDGKTLASSDSKTIKLWDVKTGRLKKTLGHSHLVRFCKLFP